MSEDLELQRRIAELAGQINRHKQEQQGTRPESQTTRPATFLPNTPYAYQRGRGRGGRFASAPGHRHRSLVLNNTTTAANADRSTDAVNEAPGSPSSSTAWVRKRDGRTNQIINKSIYSQITQQRAIDMEETYRQRQLKRDAREKAKLNNLVLSSAGQGASSAEKSIVNINGTRFQVVGGGNKLVRLVDELGSAKSTPKTFKVAGVTFVRSKHGNLFRIGYLKSNKSVAPCYQQLSLTEDRRTKTKKTEELCPRFTQTGTCIKGRECRYNHDPAKVAICREYLQKGTCALGEACDLSHESTPTRVPQCLHFVRGNCTNENCRYAHVRVNPAAPVCRAFATIGYCEKGSTCTERHIFECPDYANTGICRNKKCRLPHVDRAGQLRRTAIGTGQATPAEEDESSDLSSDEEYDEIDSDDIDSDGLSDDVIMAGTDGPVEHALSQQQDYVQL